MPAYPKPGKSPRKSPTVAPAMKAAVLERDGGMCVIAGPRCLGTASVPDHRANRGSGGARILNDMAVLIAACVLCNGWKEDVTGEDRDRLVERGVRVLPSSTHAKTLERCREEPVEYPDGRVLRLLSDGTTAPAVKVA